jgi:hypothetical protein
MNILFCNDPFEPKSVDPDYSDEFTAASNNGYSTHLVSFEMLTREADPIAATRRIKASDTLQEIFYRGWMLTPKQYTLLYDALLQKNYRLLNSPIEYQNCHYLPDSYQFIEGLTPKTVWLKLPGQQVDYDKVFKIIEPFENAPLIIKDFVKSQKHYWDTACFIPSAADKEKVRSVISTFLDLQNTDLNEGLVIREFVELLDLTIHSKSGMPLKQEYRLFFFKGKLLGCYDYWEEGEYASSEQPPMNLFTSIAKKVDSHFFSMDIAKGKYGEWIIIELGDGQVAGLPDKVSRHEFYQSLKALNGS